MNRKKIVLSSYDELSNPYYHGGGAISIHETAKGLQDTYDVTVVTSKHKAAQQDSTVDGVHYHRIGWTPDWFPPLGQLLFLWLLPFVALRSEFDLWIESFTPPYSTAFLPKWTKKPVIGLAHFLSGSEMQARYHLPFAWIERIGIATYAHIIVPHCVTAEKIKAIAPSAKITVIPNGVHLPAQTSSRSTQQISFIGRIEIAQKGLDLLINSIKDHPLPAGWKLKIAGSGVTSEVEALKRLIHEAGVQSSVQYVGRMDGTAKATLLSESAIVVVPSRFETFSMVSLEAMAAGVPVISFAIPGLSWLPADGTHQVDAYDTDALGEAIKTLIADPKARAAMGETNRAVAANYSWDRILTQYRTVIEELL